MGLSGVCDVMLKRLALVIVLVGITLCEAEGNCREKLQHVTNIRRMESRAGESHNTKRKLSLDSCVSAYPSPTDHSNSCFVYNNTKGICWASRGHQLVFGRKDEKQRKGRFYGNGMSYQGNINVTRSGIACQSWSSQCPHRHWRSPETFPELLNTFNSCRNPGRQGPKGPWCYTTDPKVRWEYCDIPPCKQKDSQLRNVPKPPRSVEAFAINSTTVRVIWTPVEVNGSSFNETQSYLVFYSVAESNVSKSVECNCRQVLIVNLQPLTNYRVHVMASNKYGISPASYSVYIATLPKNYADPEYIPIRLKAFPVNSSSIRVFWKVQYGIHLHGNRHGYRVFFQATASDHVANFTTPANVTEILLIGLRPSTNYSVYVWALNKQGVGERSPITFVRTAEQIRIAPNVTHDNMWLVDSSGLVIKAWWVAIPLTVTLFMAVCLSLYYFILKRKFCWRPTDLSDVTSSDGTKDVTVVSYRKGLRTSVDDVETLRTPRDIDVTSHSDVTVQCDHSNQGVTERGKIKSACDTVHDVMHDALHDVMHDVVHDAVHDAVYDVFICYSSKDTAWVGKLVEELEQRGFHCCVDYRDFVPGAAIVENIADAIYNSRKTIAVLSPDFLRSNWCQHELRQALTRVHVHAVVPVVYRACRVPVLLRDRTYVDWENEHGRPYFWVNLEKALKA